IGGELIVRIGHPAEVIPQLAQQYHVAEVYHHREVAYEETEISGEVEAALWKIKLNLKHFIGHTLFHKEDLPFPIKDIPDSFTQFKKKVERDSEVRPCIETLDRIDIPAIDNPGDIPTLSELGLANPVDDARATFQFKGGETAALEQLLHYISSLDGIVVNKASKHIPLNDHSSKLSSWISLGCLSQRRVYSEIVAHENASHTSNTPLILELFWRDYFRFMFKKHGKQFFKPEGFNGDLHELAINQEELFEKWRAGHTGVPFIDASMHELNATGYIPNYNRQVVASYLVNQLKVDWTLGAAYFEKKLIDYSPASNWGNWAIVAGVGNSQAEARYFSAAKQTTELETKSEFINTWLPEATEADNGVIHAESV
ncbi:MAG: DASH family cryptochrome, partial [Mucilaginibacter sp.]